MKNIKILLFLFVLQSVQVKAQNLNTSVKDNHPKKMNIVFFLVDDMGWSDVGYQNSSLYETPVIDRFAKEGVQFSQAYAACPVCSPTRGSIITGQYPARTRLTDWLPGRKDFPFQKLKEVVSAQHLPYNQETLPRVLKQNGYATAIFGKWHLGDDSATTQRQGFDLHIPNYEKGWPNGTYFSPFGMDGMQGEVKGEYLTDRLTDEALKWIDQNRFQPFFLYLAHYAVHDPLQGRGDLVVKYEKKLNKQKSKNLLPFILEGNPDDFSLTTDQQEGLLKNKAYQGFRYFPNRSVKIKQVQDNPQFAAMVESVDESLGKVISKLKELGIDKNTIIVFFSDNGGMSGANFNNPNRKIPVCDEDKAFSTSNLPFRGGKGWLYEGGIRVPLIIYWPGEGESGVVSNTPVISTDFYNTLLDMVGIKRPQNTPDGIDGMSLVPILKGQSNDQPLQTRALYWHWPNYSNHGEQSPGGAIRLGDYKLIEYYENNTVQLFNLKDDPGEQKDLSNLMPAKVKELTDKLHAWRKSVNAQMPEKNPEYQAGILWPDENEINKKINHSN